MSTAVNTQVETTHGTVRGTSTPTGLRAFRAIPYAAPPVGNLRFRAPQPAQPWTGVRNAMHHGPVAPQRITHYFTGAGPDTEQSEDCLTLSVLAQFPGEHDAPKPVLVWFHGGSFIDGAGSAPAYAGESLVANGDIILVTVNYRLGALGFLDFSGFSTPSRIFESNVGLRDQVAALTWVRDNIAAFGGDPDSVTISGQSAGATAVTTLMTVPSAQGLFHRAIAQSPQVGAVYGQDRAAHWARDFISWLRTTESLAVDALVSADPTELVSAGARLAALTHLETPGARCMSPVVDGHFLPKHPLDAFADGTAHKVPLLIGSTKHEGALFTSPRVSVLPTSAEAINLMFEICDPSAQLKVLSAYPGYPSKRARAQLAGDGSFWIPGIHAAQAHCAHTKTFVYRYDFSTPALNLIGHGAAHGTDLVPVFGTVGSAQGRAMTWLGGHEELKALSTRMQTSWLTFIRSSDPLWPAYDTLDRPTKIFGSVDRIISDPGRERRRAWEGVNGYR